MGASDAGSAQNRSDPCRSEASIRDGLISLERSSGRACARLDAGVGRSGSWSGSVSDTDSNLLQVA
jgi:hypothetical protein